METDQGVRQDGGHRLHHTSHAATQFCDRAAGKWRGSAIGSDDARPQQYRNDANLHPRHEPPASRFIQEIPSPLMTAKFNAESQSKERTSLRLRVSASLRLCVVLDSLWGVCNPLLLWDMVG